MTTREQATLIWLAVVVLLCLAGRNARQALGDLGKAFLKLKIAIPLFCYAARVIAATWSVWKVGYWDHSLVGAVLLWFLFTGFKNFLQSSDAGKDTRFFRGRLLEVVGAGALYELFLNVRTFSLWIEIVLQFVVVVVVAMRVVSDSNEELKLASTFLSALFSVLVMWLVISTALNLSDHWDAVDPHSVLALLLAPAWLTFITLPFIYVLALVGGYGLRSCRTLSSDASQKRANSASRSARSLSKARADRTAP